MTNKIPKEQVEKDLRSVKSELEEIPSKRKYDEVGEYSYRTVENKFGGWNDALEEVFGSVRKHQNVSEEELYNEIERLHKELGRAPMQKDMNEIGKFNPDTYRYRLDGWRSAVEECGIEPITRGLKSGSEHRDWKGGSTDYYHPNWSDIRQEVLERDGSCCRICDDSEVRLSVHHIKPRSEFVEGDEYDYDSACKRRNLITVCTSCHMKIEGKFIGAPHDNFEQLSKNLLGMDNKVVL